jgi:hypothetical protein
MHEKALMRSVILPVIEQVVPRGIITEVVLEWARREGMPTLVLGLSAEGETAFQARRLQPNGFPIELEEGLTIWAEMLEDWASESGFGWGRQFRVDMPEHAEFDITPTRVAVHARPSGAKESEAWQISSSA